MTIKIGLVDDHKLFRKSFCLLLSQIEAVEIVFDCSNGIDLFDMLKTKEIDILFLDIQMPVMDGFQIACKLNEKYPELKILVLSSFNDPHSIARILSYRISGYLTKNAGPTQIEKAVYCIYDNGVYYDSQIRGIIKHLQAKEDLKNSRLTEKEVELIKLFIKQYSGREIAKMFEVSLRTIEKQKEVLMQKAGASNFIGVIVFAIVRHYITEDDLI